MKPFALAVIPVVLALVFMLMRQEFERGDVLSDQVEVSHMVRADVANLLELHQDLEIGQRGLIIAGDEEFLEPYREARPKLETTLIRIVDGLGQTPEVHRLATLSGAKRKFVDRTVELTLQGRREEAVALIKDGGGKDLMDDIRGTIDQVLREEEAHLADRIAAYRSARNTVQLGVSAIFIGLSLALLLAILYTSRAMGLREESARKYREISARQVAILEGAREGIVTINPSGSIESFNRAISEMTGYDSADLLRRDIGILFEIAPDKGHKESFKRRFLRKSSDNDRTFELFGRRKDGSLFPCEVGVSLVELENRTTFVAIVRDATERKRVEQLKSEFVSTVSHELRTPLTSIAGSLGLVAGGAVGEIPEKAARLIQIARDNCDRLVRLINDILDLEKLESGRMDMHLQPLALASLLHEAVQANLGYAQEYKVDLELEEVDPTVMVIADPDLLMQVLTNLISNAIKFSQTGQTVSLRVLPLDRRWRIDVEDRGSGIPKDFSSRIFGKFAQAEASDSRQKGGTGLGLSIVREILTRMGGEVGFDSEEAVGTTFHVDLPSHVAAGHITLTNQSPVSVLHVEDDADVLDLVENALAGRYNFQTAKTLAEARGILEHFRFDIAILDFSLPDGSGRDLIPLLRAQKSRVVVFTAQDAEAEVAREVDALLIKSRSSLPGLVETLDRLLRERST